MIKYLSVCCNLVCSQQQGRTTCSALNSLIANRDSVVLGACEKNQECTSITCTVESTYRREVNQTYSFNPCSSPIQLTVLVTITGQGQTITISDVLTTSAIQNTGFGKLDIHMVDTEAGVKFGVSKYILQFDLHVLNSVFHCNFLPKNEK